MKIKTRQWKKEEKRCVRREDSAQIMQKSELKYIEIVTEKRNDRKRERERE